MDNTPVIPMPEQKRPVYMWVALIACVILLALFAWVYYFEPLKNLSIPYSDYWNDKVGDTLTLAPAVVAAALATLLTRQYKTSEPPYRIWLTFAIAWWCWVGGELLGYVYDYYYWFVDMPEFTAIDVCWLLGYVFFGLSLYYQFRLIYSWNQGWKSIQFFFYIGAALAAAVGLTQWALAVGLGEGISWYALYTAVLYPVFDIVEGGAALWLFFLFGRGYLGRPWWGLIAFAVADGINIFFWIGGYEWVSDPTYYTLDMISAMTYVGGYMITLLALLSAIEHMHRRSAVAADAPAEAARD